MIGETIGRIVGFFIFPILVFGLTWLIRYYKTKSTKEATKVMLSKKVIIIAVISLILTILGQISQHADQIS